MLGYEEKQRNLTKKQKEAVGLLSIGTFLEYFDFMLYIPLINERLQKMRVRIIKE